MKVVKIPAALALLIMTFFVITSEAQTSGPLDRVYYGARLELKDMIYNGAGQDPAGFKNYFNVMPAGIKPSIYMQYFQLKDLTPNDFNRFAQDLFFYEKKYNVYLVPQIGISMTYGLAAGEGSSCYDKEVAEGLYDDKIELLCRLLDGLGHPVFLRIGVEFNGLSWYGYTPQPFVKAFKRITDAVRAHNLEAATVWNAAFNWSRSKGLRLDNEKYAYMQYYPGDNYADWWGLSMFPPELFNHAETKKFLKNAAAHKKPVMIAETTPINIGTDNGQQDWNAWFKPYFDFIDKQPIIKALCYINWDWAQKSKEYNLPWGDWGDCRIEANSTIINLYKNEMGNPLYYHGQDEKALRRALGVDDTVPPGKAAAVTAAFNGSSVDLTWQPAEDNTKVLRYEIYKNNKFLCTTYKNTYRDGDIEAGSSLSYTVKAVDAGANRGASADPAYIKIPARIAKAAGGDFESDKHEWTVREWFGERLIFSRETRKPLAGKASAKLYVEKASGTNWHVQFGHFFKSHTGMKYTLSFTIKADAPTEIEVLLQQTHEPYAAIIAVTVTADTTPRKFTFVNTSPAQDDSLFLSFMCGKANKRTIYLDDISLIETK
ncbi:MAG: carbohydrate binding domain-containing protein [Spirochaetales bacterium]|nr:carbohydrate binding domain-containing protein [Spirochaetales bacterium]